MQVTTKAAVDEASQFGHEALLLLWLGKRVLVVGDDEQISPESIGLDHDAPHLGQSPHRPPGSRSR